MSADFTTNPGGVSSSTVEHLVAQTVDTVTSYSPSTLYFLANQKKWIGSQMRFPIKYQETKQGMAFDGLDKFSTTKVNAFVYNYFSPVGYEIPVVISGIDRDVNESNKVIDLMKREMVSNAHEMAADIAAKFYTAQTGKNFWSITDGAEDGTISCSTYGALPRGTYTTLVGSVTASVGNLTAAAMRTSFNAATHGNDSPNLILCDKTTWGYYEKLAIPSTQLVVTQNVLMGYPKFTGASPNGLPNITAPGADLKGQIGFSALYYNGVPVIADEAATSGYMFMLNTKNWGFYGLESKESGATAVKFNAEGMDGVYNIPVTTGFTFLPYQRPVDQYGSVGHILLMGNLICNNPRNQAILTGITGA